MAKVDCGEPTLPANASIQSTNGTTEGSVVIYRCDPGLIPEEDNMIVCTAGDNWSPDPSEVVCRGTQHLTIWSNSRNCQAILL